MYTARMLIVNSGFIYEIVRYCPFLLDYKWMCTDIRGSMMPIGEYR